MQKKETELSNTISIAKPYASLRFFITMEIATFSVTVSNAVANIQTKQKVDMEED